MTTFHSCFQNSEFLKNQIYSIMNFYYPRCIDHNQGGFYNCYLDDGTICNYETKHLVEITRFIYNFSIVSMLDKNARWSRDALKYGLEYLQTLHLDKKYGGYYWILEGKTPTDTTKFAYGHAFVLLAASKAFQAGIAEAADIIEYVYCILEKYFWQPEYNLYLEQMNENWSKIYPYRGQNSNMHLCDAMIAAYEATGKEKYLRRAYTLAKSVTLGLASQAEGLIWENYHTDWTIDWDYEEKDETLAQFRPRGFVPGHLAEWSKILLILNRHMQQDWLVKRAQFLFRYAITHGMDLKYGGIFYLLSREGDVIDTDKRYWVMAETIGASALLACKTSSQCYWDIYNSIFYYCWNYFVDHEYGGWYNILNRQNVRYSNVKSPVTKTDYHPITNIYEVLNLIQ
jgi:mannose/cellobiose epimerase-like protein (N-acyl-D-glucosamine 2-epimerase family)